MTELSVAVIAGGPGVEAAVSRSSADEVCRALAHKGHRPQTLELDATLAQRLAGGRFDVAFPVVHGLWGEDGCLQGLLEILDLPYVGSGVLASALAAHKPRAKELLAAAGLPVAPGVTLLTDADLEQRVPEMRRVLGRALVAKPASGGSALGVELIEESQPDARVVSLLERAFSMDSSVLVEPWVRGLEVTCGVLERTDEAESLPPTLIRPKAGAFYDFSSKYRPGGSEHVCPAPFENDLNERIRALALAAHRALGCRDLSRTDFIVAPEASPPGLVVLEVNTLPGMTSTSLFPEAAARAGIAFEALCDLLAQRALGRPRAPRPPAPAMPSAP